MTQKVYSFLLWLALLPFVALLICSCSDHSTIHDLEPEPKAIGFLASNIAHEEVTRSIIYLDEEIHTFYVCGIKMSDSSAPQTIFHSTPVKYVAGSANMTADNFAGWSYLDYLNEQEGQFVRYWDKRSTCYRFFGYTIGENTDSGQAESSAVTASVTELDGGSTQTLTLENVQTCGSNPKLYISQLNEVKNEGNNYGEPVMLNFLQPMSRIRIGFTSASDKEEETSTLSNISFQPADESAFCKNGSFQITYTTASTDTPSEMPVIKFSATGSTPETQDKLLWHLADPATVTPEHYNNSVLYANPQTDPEQEADENEYFYYVFPQDGTIATAGGDWKLNVSVNDVTRYAIVPAHYTQWTANTQYTYIFKIVYTNNEIVLSDVQIESWENGGRIDETQDSW